MASRIMIFTLLLVYSVVLTKVVLADIKVSCNEDGMTVTVTRSDVPRYRPHQLSLLDTSCLGLYANKNISFTFGYNQCKTELVVEREHVYFRNRILDLPQDPLGIISRKRPVSIEFGCRFSTSKTEALPQNLRPHAEKIVGSTRGSKRMKVKMELTTIHGRRIGEGGAIDVNVGDIVQVQILGDNLSDNRLRVAATRCFVTAESDPDSKPSYTLIDSGCAKDPTVNIVSGNGADYRFNFEAFAFISKPSRWPLFLHCDTVLCDVGNVTTACAVGCTSSRRRKRLSRRINHITTTLTGVVLFNNY